jgi:ubiquitin thioesterase OTU1
MLELIPELPLSSLGLQNGDQLIVSSSESAAPATSTPVAALSRPIAPDRTSAASTNAARVAPTAAPDGPDHVQTEAGVLIHRVRP